MYRIFINSAYFELCLNRTANNLSISTEGYLLDNIFFPTFDYFFYTRSCPTTLVISIEEGTKWKVNFDSLAHIFVEVNLAKYALEQTWRIQKRRRLVKKGEPAWPHRLPVNYLDPVRMLSRLCPNVEIVVTENLSSRWKHCDLNLTRTKKKSKLFISFNGLLVLCGLVILTRS